MERKQIFIVVAIIKNEQGEILIAKRNQPDLPEEHQKWEFVGGGINFGETPEQALRREAKEEAGIELDIIRLLPKVQTQLWQNQNPQRQIIMLNYECRIVSGTPRPNDPEISEVKFVSLQELKKLECLPNVYKMAEWLLTNP